MVVLSNVCDIYIYIYLLFRLFIDMHFETDHPMGVGAIMILLFMFYMLKSPEDDQVDGWNFYRLSV